MVKAIYHTVSETLLLNYKDPEKPRVLLLGPISVPEANIGGTTIHSTLVIKLVAKLSDLSDKAKASSIKNKLPGVKVLMIDEVSLISSDPWTEIDARLS